MNAILDDLEKASSRAETRCGDRKLVWHEWGSGKPLILLHGGAGSWRHWARNIPFLAKYRRVIAPDTPGLGESDQPPSGTDFAGLADILVNGIAERLGNGIRYDLAGFSFGAVIASQIAAHHAATMDRVILIGVGSLGLPRQAVPLVSVRERSGTDRIAAHRANLASLMLAKPESIDALALEIQAWNSDHARFRSRSILSATSVWEVLPEIRVPMSVIYGEQDAIAFPHIADRVALFRTLCPEAEVQVIPDAGHWVMFEAPEAVNRAFARILSLQQGS